MPDARGTALATLLFTDIVGSSQLADELGDRRWRELLARHHAIVRRELKRWHGRELDTAGDGFFAAFSKPAEAVRAACAISDAVGQLGIAIRTGLHVGEAEVFGPKLSGVTVHIAARTMSLAGPGEVLVTGVLKDLVPGARFEFGDRGEHALKGIPGTWHLFLVRSVDGQPRAAPPLPDQQRERLDAIQPPKVPRQLRVSLIGLGVLVALVVGAVAIAERGSFGNHHSGTGGHSPLMSPPKGELAIIDPSTRKLTKPVPLDFVPGPIVFAEGSVWVVDESGNQVIRFDPVSRRVVARIKVGRDPVGLAYGAGSIWVADHLGSSVSRVDPGRNTKTSDIQLDFQPAQVAANDQAVWAAEKGVFGPTADAGLATIEPSTNRVIDTIRFHEAPYCPPILGTGRDSGWAVDAFGQIRKLDPRGGDLPPFTSSHMAFAGVLVDEADGIVWFGSDGSPGAVVSLDPSTKRFSPGIPVGTTLSRIGPGCDPVWLTLGGNYLWVSNADDRSLSVIATVSRQGVGIVALGGKPSGLAFGDDQVWAAVDLP